ncbi:MAG TPA: hypothetical protein VIX89_01270 [Bryobacteraceae bacterium]
MKTTRFLREFDFAAKRDWLSAFYRFDIASYEELLRTRPAAFWQKAGGRRALRIFHLAAATVPAYADFLKQNGVDPRGIRTLEDFAQVPVTDKRNYINQYPLASRCWNGALDSSKLLAMSSGTTGEPILWPRGAFQEFEAAVTHELLYRGLFEIDRYRTLLIVGFPMGLYVSGVATALPSWLVSQKDYRLTVASVGNDKHLLLKLLRALDGQFEQVVIIGHPLFVKEVIDAARIPRRVRVRLMFCSEGFSESWRSHVVGGTKQKPSPTVAISTYGSSELLLIAYETPATLLLRRKLERSSRLRAAVLNDDSVPNLFQYNPFLRFAEQVGDEVAFTAASGIPLVRFNLHDRARILPGFPATAPSWNLPLVALWGRSDHGIVFYAVNIYPEHVRLALEQAPFAKQLTGRFSMTKRYSRKMDEILEIHAEMAPGQASTAAFTELVSARIVHTLLRINIEYRDASLRLGNTLRPRLTLWPYQHEKYFRVGLKPKYIVAE